MTHPQRVMVITGASSGFGRELALLAARAGYRVVVTARRAERLEELAAEITAAGGTALALPGDVTDEAHQQALVDETLKRYGRIDMLVNNAGIPLKGGFAGETLDALRNQWQTNVTSIITLTRRALPALIGAQGVVVNVGSVAGHFSLPGWGLYFPSKVAVASISDALRRELGPLGVKVCLVEPGPYDTEFSRRAGKAEGGYAAVDVAAAILRLGDRPRRRVIMPFWLAPLLAVGSTLTRTLPGLVDLFFALRAKQEQRRLEREEMLRHR
ncbi:MAG TPA: SDR family NAD(P)-dependent oxidoreductase [Roseiflexaceae bacterium]|nr:SDR family NAD(P)-dependent oxidoreductase [Roseiflexaceae bacterium]